MSTTRPTVIPPQAIQHRIGWVDYAKIIAIFLVVLLHTHSDIYSWKIPKGFVIPAFFFISGFLFSEKRNPDFGAFALKRFRQLIIPYVWISLVSYIFWLLEFRYHQLTPDGVKPWHMPLIGLVSGTPAMLSMNIPLWSFVCFYVVEMAFYLLHCLCKVNDWLTAIICYVAGAAASQYFGCSLGFLPLSAGPALTCMPFYCLGHIVSRNRQRLKQIMQPNLWIIIAGATLLAVGTYFNFGKTMIYLGYIGNPFWYLLTTIGGIACLVQLSMLLDRWLGDPAFIQFISRGTLIICGFQRLAAAVVKAAIIYCCGLTAESAFLGFGRGFLVAVAIVLLCLPVEWFIERHARFLVSK